MEPALVLFGHMVQRADDEIDLAAAALLVAEVEYPGLDVAHYVSMIDAMAEGARAHLGVSPEGEPPALSALNFYLFEELGFRGNEDEYYDPKNSFLNEVIDRRLGIPITMCVLYMEVGRRLGLDLAGISFPGHFLVRLNTPSGDRVIDPYHGGVRLDREDLEERVRTATDGGQALSEEHLQTAGKRQILTRMLNNLRTIYRQAGDARREQGVVERLALLNPKDGRLGEALEALRRRGGGVN